MKMNRQSQKIIETTSQELLRDLQGKGESWTTISSATGMTRSQVSLVANGKRELGERYFRKLIKLAIEK